MFEILAQDDVERIDRVSLNLLSRMGVRIDSDSVRRRLVSAGAQPSSEADTLILPEGMVRDLVARCPTTFELGTLAGAVTSVGPNSRSQFWTANAMHVVSGKDRHEIRSGDLAELTRVVDSLDNVSAMVGTSVVDAPPPARDFVGFRVMAQNTRKHLRPCMYSPMGVDALVEMAGFLLGGVTLRERPIFSLGYTAISPLHWTATALGIFERSTGHGIPMMVNGETIAGSTAPVTLAGAIAAANADVLSGIAILQLLEPGRPCVHNIGFSHTTDMRTGSATCASPEAAMIAAAGAQLARRYGLPSASWVSSDGSICDGQSANEMTLGFLMHCLAGVTLVWGVGSLESELSISPEKLVLDDEYAAAAIAAAKPITVSDETLAEDILVEAGRGEGFLGHEHTFKHFRTALWQPLLGKRGRRESWLERGGRTIEESAQEKVREILKSDPPHYLTDAQESGLREIERKWLARLLKQAP